MSEVTPRRELMLMAMSQAQKEVTYNQSMMLLDVQLGGVNSADTATPPTSPSEGDAYIVPTDATGIWASHVDEVAYWFGGQWNYLSEVLFSQGLPIAVQDTSTYKKYSLDSPNEWITVAFGGATVAEFTDLLDVPGSYSGASLKGVRVNSSGTGLEFYDPQGDGSDASSSGFRGIPQNSQGAAYTCVLADAGKHILHPAADTTARIFTIPANSSVAFPVGAALTFVNQNAAGAITIAITTDTMRLAGVGTTGSRLLAANGIATALKITATEWLISGTGLI